MFKQLEQLQGLYNNNNHNKNNYFGFQFDNEKYLNASQELKEFNIIREYHGLQQFLQLENVHTRDYKQARFFILQYIINCTNHDHINGDYSDKQNDQLIIDAGHLLYKFDGMKGMNDDLVWSFIPKRYHNNINFLWNGIGEWLA